MKWRFDPFVDAGASDPNGLPVTWINVDEPALGSMRIVHNSGCSTREAVRRTTLAAAAPELLECLEKVLKHEHQANQLPLGQRLREREEAHAVIAKARRA